MTEAEELELRQRIKLRDKGVVPTIEKEGVGFMDAVRGAAGGLAGLGQAIDIPFGKALERIPQEAPPTEYREGRPLTALEGQYERLPWYAKPGTLIGGAATEAARAGLGFLTQTPKRLLVRPEEQTFGEAVGEEAKGFGRMIGHLPAQAQFAMFPGVRPEIHAKSPLVQAPAAIAGEAPEEFQREAVKSIYETRGTEPLFAASMLAAPAGALKGRGGKIRLGKGKGKGSLLEEAKAIEMAERSAKRAKIVHRIIKQRSMKPPIKSAKESARVLEREVPKPIKSAKESARVIEQKKPIKGGIEEPFAMKSAEAAAAVLEKEIGPREAAQRSLTGKRYLELRKQGLKPETLEKAKWVGLGTGAALVTASTFMDDDENVKKALGFGLLVAATRPGKTVIKRVKADGTPFTRPIKRVGTTEIGKEVQQHVVKVFTDQKAGKANHITRMMDTYYKHWGRGVTWASKAPQRWKDHRWLREHGKAVMEGKVRAPNERIQDFVNTWSDVSKEIATDLEKLGHEITRVTFEKGKKVERKVPFKRLENYFPHILTDNARIALETQKGNLWDAISKEARSRGIDPTFLAEEMNPYSTRRYGSVDFARIANFPDQVNVGGKLVKILETDPLKVIPRHIELAHKRISIIREFGKDATAKVEKIGRKLQQEEGSFAADAWKDMWADMNGFPVDKFNHSHWAFRGGDALLQIARAGQLTLAALANVGGYYPVTVRHGPKAFARAFIDSFRSNAFEPLAQARRAGGWSYDVLSDLYMAEDLHGVAGSIARGTLKVTGMNAINRHINKVGSLAAMYDLEAGMSVIRKGKTGALRQAWGLTAKEYRTQLKKQFKFTDADINRMVEKGPKQSDFARVAQMTPEAINLFRETGMTRPRWMSKYMARQVFAYTGFVRAFGNVASDALSSAKRGNVKPLATLLFGGAASGELILALKGLVYDRKREDKTWYSRLWHDLTFAGTLGLLGEAAQRVEFAIDYDENPVDITPPPLATLQEVIDAGIDVLGEKQQPTGERFRKALLKSAPIARALWRTHGRVWRGDEYIADRVRYSVYLGWGENVKGERYSAGEPKPKMFPKTTQMLLDRAEKTRKPGGETIVQRLWRENREKREEKRDEARR
jgi:hypothetical protein